MLFDGKFVILVSWIVVWSLSLVLRPKDGLKLNQGELLHVYEVIAQCGLLKEPGLRDAPQDHMGKDTLDEHNWDNWRALG